MPAAMVSVYNTLCLCWLYIDIHVHKAAARHIWAHLLSRHGSPIALHESGLQVMHVCGVPCRLVLT